MLDTISGLFNLVGSGAGGVIIGGITGLWKQHQEKKERIAMANINLERDKIDLENEREQRAFELERLDRGATIERQQAQVEGEIALDLANIESIGAAQSTLNNLKTSTKMDNYRGSVRPTIAYWIVILFSIMLGWSFWSFNDAITSAQGLTLLLNLFSTLTFTMTSVVSFYYVARRNTRPNI